jgi:CHAT domain-containing protein
MKNFVRVLTIILGLATLGLGGCSTGGVSPSVQAIFDEASKAISAGDIKKAQAQYEKGVEQAISLGDELGMGLLLFASGIIYQSSKDYVKADSAFLASLDHFANAKSPSQEALALTTLAYIDYQKGQYEKAINLVDRALPIFENLINKASGGERNSFISYRAGGHFLKAQSHAKLKQFDAASESYLSAVSDFRFIEDRQKLGATLWLLAGMFDRNLKQREKSIPYYIEAIPLLEMDNNFVSANLARLALGLIYRDLGKRENFEKAAQILKDAVRVANTKNLTEQVGNAHLFFGGALEELANYEEALEQYQLFLKHDRNVGGGDDGPARYEFLENKALIYRNIGRYEEAIANYRTLLLKLIEIGDKARQAHVLTGLADIYVWIGDAGTAIPLYKRALNLYETTGDRINQINVLSALGELVISGAISAQEATEYFSAAGKLLNSFENLNLFPEIVVESGDNVLTRERIDAIVHERLSSFQPSVLKVAGTFYQRAGRVIGTLGNIDMGLVYLSLALKYHEALPPPRYREDAFEQAKDWYFLGEGFRQKQLFKEALNHFSRAEELVRFVRSPEIHWVYAGLAKTYEDMGDHTNALTYYKKGLATLESIHDQQGTEQAKIGVFTGALYAYKRLVPLLLKIYQNTGDQSYIEDAFQTTERLKGRAFREMFITSRASREAGELGEIATKSNTIRTEMGLIRDRLEHARTDSLQGNRLLDRLEELQTSLDKLRLEEIKQNPANAQIFSPEPVTLSQVQQALEPDTALLEFTFSDQQIILWVITKEGVRYALVNKTEKPILQEYLRTLREPVIGSGEILKHVALGKELYKVFLEPVDEYLRGKKNLIIAPHGDLYYLPFEALIRTGKELDSKIYSNLADVPYLIKYYQISYISSASAIVTPQDKARNKKELPRLPLLAFGDPIYQAERSSENLEGPIAALQNLSLRGREFKRLEYSGEEVRRIASVWNISPTSEHVNLQEKASVERVREMDLSKYHILHFATHAVLGDKISLASEPALILSQKDNTEKGRGTLQFSDILTLKLNADLVVLSACETGLGKYHDGEGIVGLTRAFFYAGASSAVVSLWKVEDQSTALLMERFYQRLKTGQNKAQALRQAKLEIIGSSIKLKATGTEESLAAPFFWAPFILIGDWEPIHFN